MSQPKDVPHTISERFNEYSVHLAIRFNKDRDHKFCKQCGHMMECSQTKLNKHYENNHKDLDMPEWLPRTAYPENCEYSNFYAFLINPSLDLIKI